MTQSPELAGGAGFTYSDQVATRYLASLLLGSGAPGLLERQVVRIALEQRDAGEPLDDIVVDGRAPDGSTARLSLQVKRELTISAAKTNTDFRDIVRDSWATIEKIDFREGVDKVGAVVGPSTAVGKWRDLVALAEFATASETPADFAVRFAPKGSASKEHRTILKDLQRITKEQGRPATVEEMHKLLRHFVLIRFDTLHDGAVDDATTIALLQQALAPDEADRGFALAAWLCGLARRGAGTARSWERSGLRLAAAPFFRLAMDRWLAGDIERLLVEVRHAAASISDKIGEATLDRPTLRSKLAEAMVSRHLVALRGLPGAGKSVVLRREVEAALSRGPVLLLKADRLSGASWAQYATSLGLVQHNPSTLMREIAVLGTSTLFIDGLDRIDKAHRGIIIDLFSSLEVDPELSNWHVLATLRDSGIEPVRTWLPQVFDGGRMTSIDVGALDEDEAEELAVARPGLRPLLFGPEPVRTLVRRPFFAKVLDGSRGLPGDAPRSEIELSSQWWARGGFDAEGGQARLRQRALLKLVRLRALRPDAAVALEKLDDGLLPVVQDLIVDGVLEDSDGTHFVRFAHDIFFEWSFAQLLASAGSGWIDELRGIGEPPVVGRAVDLRAQAAFISNHTQWAQTLTALEDPTLRSQWRRVWLLAPLNNPEFPKLSEAYHAIVSANDHALLRRALVWFQAQHTAPNVAVLNGSLGEIADRDVRLRTADLLGWPDDFRLWIRFLDFIDTHLPTIPHRLFPHVLTLFEVWQNALADTPNAVSTLIVKHASDWLAQLEARRQNRGRFRNASRSEEKDPWHELEGEVEFEQPLRHLLLRAARVEAHRVSAYLRSFTPEHPARSKIFDDVMSFAPLLSQTHAHDLADFAFGYFRQELPEDRLNREIEEEEHAAAYRKELRSRPESELDWSEQMSLTSPRLSYSGSDHRDWETLSLERESTGYFPASPLHQPFRALFASAADEALRLVGSMANHAIEAWRQLHRLQPRRGTPIPLTLNFPWGRQTFWGGVREYLWSRGQWAPKPLASGYLALDNWALEQISAGADADTLIERIVTDNASIAVLGIALNVAQAHSSVSPVSEALLSSLRLWEADVTRCAQEVSIRSTSQIGFHREDQREDAKAVEALNTHAVRFRDIRNLATLHVLQRDAQSARRVRATITRFAETPSFEVEEARHHPDALARAVETARTFAAWGNIEHYRIVEVPDQPDHKAIVMLNPISDEPAVKAKLEDGQAHLRTFSLFHWAEKSFEAGALDASLTIDDAIAGARSIDYPALFDLGQHDDQVSIKRGAVAGVAAVLTAFTPSTDRSWAQSVLTRAAAAREEARDLWSSVSVVSWHHAIFVARAAAAELRRNPQDRQLAETLFMNLAHPLDCVGLETAKELASLWEIAPHLSWVGLGLALDLCIVDESDAGVGSMYDPDAGQDTKQRKIRAALLALDGAPTALPIPPGPWIRTDTPTPRSRRLILIASEDEEDRDEEGGWRLPDGWWRSDQAGKILGAQPLKTMLAQGFEAPFVDYCRAMLSWTIERNAPSWAERARDVQRSDMFEWTHKFAELLGGLVGLIDPQIATDDFLAPVCAVNDEDACFDILDSLVTMFICQHVLDAPEVALVTPNLLERSLDRLLAAATFKPGRYHAGELYGFSMPNLVRWMMFVGVEKAPRSYRFSNGDWSEISLILVTVDRFVRQAGWAPTVMSHFLTLAERARDHFPAEKFADAIIVALTATADPGARWRGTYIASRIAVRVQDLADRASPLELGLGQKLLRILDLLVDQGDRRSAALQIGPAFRDLRLTNA